MDQVQFIFLHILNQFILFRNVKLTDRIKLEVFLGQNVIKHYI